MIAVINDINLKYNAGKPWEELAAEFPVILPYKLWEEIYDQYDAPHRLYHTTHHLQTAFKEYKISKHKTEEGAFALLFHAFVYDPAQSDNQFASAKVARTVLAALDWDMNRDYVERLIKLSADRVKMVPKLTPKDVTSDEAVFLDCIQWVLASDTETYQTYLDDLEQEWSSLGTTKFRLNRKLWLNKMLSFDRIFLSDEFLGREEAARNNLKAEMERRTMKIRNGKLLISDDAT